MTAPNHLWLPAPTDFTLLPDDVHVWRIDLDQPEQQLQSFAETLSNDELARAKRFYFEEHRQRFIVGRGSLRAILGCYLGIEPIQVQFAYEARGKPLLADAFASSGLSFNLSHSQGLGLIAVNCTRKIGVDLECIRRVSDIEALAKRFFLAREYEVLRSLSPEQQQETFFRYWTCKEAYLKATGDGLFRLEEIEVLLSPTEPARLQTLEDWGLVELVPGKDFVAAVAVAGLGWDLKCWQY
jgi:4'-phosphopantetheinyl transferase